MFIGADYYPEHRSRDLWETDARLMQEAGFNVVRMAEFAWAFFEPEEGRFEFDWLDEPLDILRRHGIQAILGTPTAAMPAWVARKYPEVLALQANGQRFAWGVRKHNCFTSGAYRLLSERVTRAMAEHYKDAPGVAGWQTDNEFGHPYGCYCDSCRADFQDWLRARHGSLDALNAAWGTQFWGQTYRTWGEIVLPTDVATYNPGLCLDWRRWNSWLNVRFQRDQVRILRQVCPAHFVTHNFMGLFKDLDYYELAEDLDVVSWDNYPVWGAPGVNYDAAAAADVMRGLKRQNFWIMEQTAGAGGWGSMGRNPRPGEIRQVAYQQLAHGADAQVWFRWDACNVGREQYWHGLIGHDNRPLRRYQEAAQVAREYHRLAPELAGTTVETPVAMIYDYESIWAFDIQPAYGGSPFSPAQGGNTCHNAMRRYYKALLRAGVNVDMIKPSQDLSPYDVVFAPHLYLLPDAVAQSLIAFVERGGVLIADGRTAVKDEFSRCYNRTLPGLLSGALGIEIQEYEALTPDIRYGVVGKSGFGGKYTGVEWADWVIPARAEALADFEPWHLASYAALTRNRFGQGWGYYVGANMAEDAFYDALVAEVLKRSGLAPAVRPPAGVEASVRSGGGKKLLFLINHTEERQTVAVPAGKIELLSGAATGAKIVLDRYGVAVIKL
jgi:beta-galactosidase